MTERQNKKPLPDIYQRDLIDSELNTSMLVEAAAGTGKTTKMIDRMIALIREGKCSIDRMAAITFTRKAAAEMRSRFHTRLESEASAKSGQSGRRLREAAENVGKCYIGTIHSFCARLLRERPVEAEVPLEFDQIEDEEDHRLRLEAWDTYCGKLFSDGDMLPEKMARMGMDIGDLRDNFDSFADYPDVENWPSTPPSPLPGAESVRSALYQNLNDIQNRVLPFIEDEGNDKLLRLYKKLPFLMHHTDWSDLASVERLLLKFDKDNPPSTVQKQWPGEDRDEKKAFIAQELERWCDLRDNTARPWLGKIYEHRYALAMEAFQGAKCEYDRLRGERKVLNFQDLLIKSAKLLRKGGEHIRNYFSRRFSHLLVDEFQDTDPVQAEIMLLLASDDPAQTDWRKCRPRPGSLFIVGDPKQSIYRFRRADLVTYNEVKRNIAVTGGRIIQLSSNFRSTQPVLNWVNKCFEGRFPSQSDDYSPAYVNLNSGLDSGMCDLKGEEPPVEILKVPQNRRNKEQVLEYESKLIAAYINSAMQAGHKIRRPSEDNSERPLRPADFLIVTWRKENLGCYARELDRLGIPNTVTGGTVLNEVPQIRQLHTYLSALVRPHDPVALVAALRGELFGLDDPSLYQFKKAGGVFDWRSCVPDTLEKETRGLMEGVFAHFRSSRGLIESLPAMTAVERIAEQLGLTVMAAASRGGNVQAGSIYKALELLRNAPQKHWSISGTVEYLGELARSEEHHDGTPARPFPQSAVRIMNLHKVKGLQAPIVFLADPSGNRDHPPHFHIERRGRGDNHGYLKLQRREGYTYRTIARPPGWEEWEEEEKKFDVAEQTRLLYVSVTRAENKLIITQRKKGNQQNPWTAFEPESADCPVLEQEDSSPGSVSKHTEEVPAEEIREACGEDELKRIEECKKLLRTPGYCRESAKQYVRGQKVPAAGGGGRGYGLEWGNIIHTLLEARVRDCDADLWSLARRAVRERNMPESIIDEAVELVESLTASSSGIMARARRSRRFLTEVPYTYQANEENGGLCLMSGVIDLAFQEESGWVIVDYKTDAAAADPRGSLELTESYRKQVENYVEAWRKCTGDPVKEAGIYYTAADKYVRTL